MVPREYGTYCYALSVIPLLAVVANLGLPLAAVRVIPRHLALGERGWIKGFVRASGIMVVGTSSLLVVLLLPISWLCLKGDLRTSLLFAVPMLFGFAVLQLLQAFLRAQKRIAASQISEQCLVPLVLITAAIAYKISGVTLTGGHILFVHAVTLAVAGIGLTWFVARVFRSQTIDVSAQYDLRDWLGLSIPLAFSAGIWILITRVDIVLIGATLGTKQVAAYAVPQKLAALMYLSMTALDSILSPMLAEHQAKGNQREVQRLVTTTANWTLLATIPLFAVFVLFGESILSLFGNEYRASTNILLILIVGQLSTLLVGPVDSVLTMMGHHKAYVRILSTTGVGTLVLMPVGIYLGGLEGAACVASGSLVVWKIWLARFAYVRIHIKSWALARTP